MGTLSGLTTWPVKSLAGGTARARVAADRSGLADDRRWAVTGLDGRPLSARKAPGLLRWSATEADGGPLLTGPDGRQRAHDDPGLAAALSEDLQRPVALRPVPAGAQDLPDSVLVTTAASHREVERQLGRALEPARWRTNLHLDLTAAPYAEDGWEGSALRVGEVVLRLLHPCQRCTIPTYAPGGLARAPEVLRFFAAERQGPFGINARVEVPGVLRAGDPVELLPA